MVFNNVSFPQPMDQQVKLKNQIKKPVSPANAQQININNINFKGGTDFVTFTANAKPVNPPGIYPEYKLEINADNKVSKALATQIQNLAKTKIESKPSWNIEKPNVWMVTAETSTFMKTGGLGDVAVDLPEAFNKSYNKDGSKMTIVQPLYESGDLVQLKDNGDGTYTYTSKPMGGSIKLEDTGVEVKVPTEKGKETTVRVLKGNLNGTEYRFLQNKEFFGDLPNDGKKVSPYVANSSGVGESERFAFLSKAAAYYIKELKEKNPEDAPNVIDANDWHAGPLAAQLRYLMPAKAEKGDGVSKEVAKELQELPIVYTVHNLEYQGWDHGNTSKILNMLYEGYTDSIFQNANTDYMKDTPKTLIVRDTYNAAVHGLSLADKVIAVSPNYAKEIATKQFFGYDFVKALKARDAGGSLTGIVNGIGQEGIAPDGKLADKVYKKFPEFKKYNKSMSPAEIQEARAHNKQIFVNLLQSGEIKEKLNLTPAEPPKGFIGKIIDMIKDLLGMKKPDEGKALEFLSPEDIEKTPILTVVSRLEGQKGPDIMADSIKHALTKPVAEGQPLPVVVILGTGGGADKLMQLKKDLPKELSDRVVFYNAFSVDLMHMIQTAGDMFLMPSKFEPCGLGQLQAMAKGNIPVATATGGLSDTIENGKTGFLSKYYPETPGAAKDKNKAALQKTTANFNNALDKALKTFYNQPKKFQKIAHDALQKDFSWEESGSLKKYLTLFQTGSIEEPQAEKPEA